MGMFMAAIAMFRREPESDCQLPRTGCELTAKDIYRIYRTAPVHLWEWWFTRHIIPFGVRQSRLLSRIPNS